MNTEMYSLALTVKHEYLTGVITKDEAIKKIKPYADFFNDTAKRLAKKYNQRAKKFNFESFMR